MKKLILSAMASLLLFACQSDNSEVAVGEGKIAITVTTSADVATRAEGFTLQTPALSDFQLLITGENFSKSWASVTDYRTDDERYTAGDYTVAINAGDATVEGYGKSAFAASEQVTVLDRNRTTEVKLTARLANAIVEVRTTEMFDNYFPQSEFSVTTAANTFEWNNSAKICPVETLYNHVYTGDGAVYYVSKNENKNTKIINGASSFTLDDSAKYVYYKDDGDLMCAKISHGADAKGKAKLIAEDAGAYVVTSDRKYVYYIEDDSLYAVNGKKGGKAKMISNDDVSSGITISNKDVVYYTSDGDVYAAKGRSKGKKVLEDASFNRFGGYVYISDDDVLYAARGTSKPKKLLDRE
jgi:hypothetical protein